MSTPSSRAADGAGKSKGGSMTRRGRETVAALVLLPVLLGLGIFLTTQLSGDDDTTQASSAPTSAPVLGPVVPSVTTTGLDPTPAASTAPAATTAPTSAAPSAAPSSAAPSSAAPSAAPSSAAPSAAPTTAAPSAQPSSSPTAAPSPPAAPPASPTGVRAAPVPAAGADAVFGVGSVAQDVRTWQARMAERGWKIAVDGIFGPQSRSVAERFQAEKGLTADGVVGPQTWKASWTAPITPP